MTTYLSVQNAYDEDGEDREKLLSQIKALIPIIARRNNKGLVYFTPLFDTLHGPTLEYKGSCKEKALRAKRIRQDAQDTGIVVDKWDLRIFPTDDENNKAFRNFIFQNKDVLGGFLQEKKTPRRTMYVWKKI